MELKDQVESLHKAFDTFKTVNDKAMAELKANGKTSGETETKLQKVEAEIQKIEKSIEGLNAALARTKQENDADPEKLAKEEKAKYGAALKNFMRFDDQAELKALQPWAKKSMSIDSDPDGGFLVTPEMSSEIVSQVHESNVMRQLASVQQISTSSLKMTADNDLMDANWVGERASRAATDTPQIRELEFFVHELYVNPQATQALLDDASINLEAWLAGKAIEGFAVKEATGFVSGNGVGKPFGILSYASGTSHGQIERVATATNSAIVGEDLFDVQTALKEKYQKNASWQINRSRIGGLRKLKDAITSQYIWQPGLQAGTPSLLLDKPVYMNADLPSAITATTDTIIYGDVKAGYQVVDRVGIRVLRDAYTNKPYIGFYTTKRVGGGVKNFEALKVMRIKT